MLFKIETNKRGIKRLTQSGDTYKIFGNEKIELMIVEVNECQDLPC